MHKVEALPEAERNRQLRRADWRFLLPEAAPSYAALAAGGQLAQAVAAVAGQVGRLAAAPEGEADLVVADTLAPGGLRAAWTALQPGGALYVEQRRPTLGGWRQVRQRLERLGFIDIACYWPWPAPERAPAVFWLPLEAPNAIDHFLGRRAAARSGGGRLGQALLASAWRLGWRLGWLFPISVVARKPGRAVSLGDALAELRGHWAAWGFGPAPRRLASVLLTGGQHSLNKAVRLIYADDERQPRLVVKYPRVAAAAETLRREAVTLSAVQASQPGGVAGAPVLLRLIDGPSGVAVIETALGGTPLYSLLTAASAPDLALGVAEWLAQLVARTAAVPRAEWWDRLVETPLREFEAAFAPVLSAEQRAKVRAGLEGLGDLPLAIEQRDCAPWNILVDQQGQLAVLDWESAEPRGLPGTDLTYFLAYLVFFQSGAMQTGHFREAWQAAQDPNTRLGGIVRAGQQRYLALTGLEAGALPGLRLLTWLIHSRSELQRLEAAKGRALSPADLRGSLFYQLMDL